MEARPKANIVWRQGVREVAKVEVGKRVVNVGRKVSELVFDIVEREELGAYTCVAKNSLGEASALLILPGELLPKNQTALDHLLKATFDLTLENR